MIRAFYWEAADFKNDPLFRAALDDAWWEGFSTGDPLRRGKKECEEIAKKNLS